MRRGRQRRSIWVGVCVLVVFFAGVTLALAWLGGGPDIPHAVDGDQAACLTCHPADILPDTHHGRVNDSCRSCHSEKDSDAIVSVRGSESDGAAVAGDARRRPRRPLLLTSA